MLEQDAMTILMKFLDKKALEAEREITQRGMLSDDKAIPLILKTQFNHIAHLEEMVDERFERIDKRFEQVDKRFEQVDRRFEEVDRKMDRRFDEVDRRIDRLDRKWESRFSQINRNLMTGFAFLSLLMAAFRFIH